MLDQVSRALQVMVVLVTACGMLLLLAQVGSGCVSVIRSWWSGARWEQVKLRVPRLCFEFAMLSGWLPDWVAAIGAGNSVGGTANQSV